MKYRNIPRELTELVQWVCTLKGSKMPVMASEDFYANSIDSHTWGCFKDACEAVELKSRDNIGFVFSENDNYVGIDLDNIYQTPESFSKALKIIELLDGYSEKSQSGKGIHIIVKGTVPFSGRSSHGIEVYGQSRFFIMTGDVVTKHDKIPERQKQLNVLLKDYMKYTSEKPKSIYVPVWKKPDKKIKLQPDFPPIENGRRNISLTSLAGQLKNVGYEKGQIYVMLLKCNKKACDPPLEVREVRQIVNSVMRYKK